VGFETEIIHYATAQRLKELGYCFHHEHHIPGAGMVDFLAWIGDRNNRDGDFRLIECKPEGVKVQSAVDQLMRYVHGFETPVIPTLVVPIYCVYPRFRDSLRSVGIDVLGVDTGLTKRMYKRLDGHTRMQYAVQRRIEFSYTASKAERYPADQPST
jgi:hypothetical protein